MLLSEPGRAKTASQTVCLVTVTLNNSDASATVSLCDHALDRGVCDVNLLVLWGSGVCVFVGRRLSPLPVQSARDDGVHILSGGLSGWRDCARTSVWDCLFQSCDGVFVSCCRNRRRDVAAGHGRDRDFESRVTVAACGLSSRLPVE